MGSNIQSLPSAAARVQLPTPHIDRHNLASPMLKQTIGKASCAGPHVETTVTCRINTQVFEGPGQLVSTSGDVARGRTAL